MSSSNYPLDLQGLDYSGSSAPTASSQHPPSLPESRRPSSPILDQAPATPEIRYPSVSEDLIGSYYYGTYGSTPATVSSDTHGPPGAPVEPSPPAPALTQGTLRRLSPSSSPRLQRISDTRPPRRSSIGENAAQDLSLGDFDRPQTDDRGHFDSPLHDHQQAQLPADRYDQTPAGSPESPQRTFLDSPEESSGPSYFADLSQVQRPRYQRTQTEMSGRSSVLMEGGWLQHDAQETGRLEEDEVAILRTHAAPRGYVRDSIRRGSRSPEARRGMSVSFASPRVAYISSPTSQSPDLEEHPRQRPVSSADMYATGVDRDDYGSSATDQARQGLTRLSKSIRRISSRVTAGGPFESRPHQGHIRLIDNGEEDEDSEAELPWADASGVAPGEQVHAEPMKGLQLPLNLRGKSLGFMGPDNTFRRGIAILLNHWWVEPLVLMLIIAHMVILIIQSARDVFDYPRKPNYFGYWEDYAIFGIFCAYTVELFARIVVSGLIINPPPVYYNLTNPAEVDTASPEVTATQVASPPGAFASSPQSSLSKRQSPSLDRKRMSRSNTLDAFAEFGDSIKSRAQSALRTHEGSNDQHQSRPPPSRKGTTMSNRTSVLEPDTTFPATPAMSRSPSGTLLKNGSASAAGLNTYSLPTVQEQESALPTKLESAYPGYRPTPQRQDSSKILHAMHKKAVPFVQAMIVQRSHAPHYAYLRHSWNRVDMISVLAFWVSFSLAVTGHESTDQYHIFIFRAISVLRIARLLAITSGTTTILHSLKVAAPLLFNVLVFTSFAMLLFSITGIQSFKGSYRRACVWEGDLNTGINAEPGSVYTLSQICGGWFDSTGQRHSYIQENGMPAPGGGKGYFCPLGQRCLEQESNPFSNTQSFDNILTSLLEVIIVISSNGWSGTMYDMIDSDYFASVFYFIIGIIFLNFWLANLFVAVITNSFATISAQTNQSAFAAKNLNTSNSQLQTDQKSKSRARRKKVANAYKRIWGYTKYIWLAAIIANLGSQASRTSYQTSTAERFVANAELWFTIAFDVEILLRFLAYLLDDDWRSFYGGGNVQSTRNIVDTILCVLTSIMEIPVIRNSRAYAWMTIFQLQRFYRVIVAIPRIEALIVRVFASLGGLFNMIAFLMCMVGLASIVAVQLFRGDIPAEIDGETVEMNFKHIYNSFLAMYQIFSSENWNTVLFDVLTSETSYKQGVISGIFLCGWFLFSNFIVLQMFIAVINEGFSISEAERRRQQLDLYVRRLEPKTVSVTGRFLYKFSPYRWLKNHNASILGQKKSQSDPADGAASGAVTVLDEKNERRRSLYNFVDPSRSQRITHFVRRLLRIDRPEQRSVPLDTVRQRQMRQSFSGADVLRQGELSPVGTGIGDRQPSTVRRQSTIPMLDGAENDAEAARIFARERQLTRIRTDLGLALEKPTQSEIDAAYVATQEENPRITMAKAINAHPSFDKSLWLFTNHSKFRRFCQSLVPPSYGERIFGRPHNKRRYRVVQIVIFSAIVGSIVVAGVASPLYRKAWYATNGVKRGSWFTLSELFLSTVFFIEFWIKIVADGVAFTPNAYLLAPWNLLDLLVLGSLVVNVTSELVVIGGVSRFTRALKAFRALRLINLSKRMRSTFEHLLSSGGRFLDASGLAILYIIPFAVWGQNLFSGTLYACNDGSSSIINKGQCVGEYMAQPSEWTFLAPRVWDNPTDGSAYSFDDFRSSLLILFEIVSLEGWINVMQSAMAIVGLNQQPSTDAAQVNALYFVIYNLMGAVFVLTLFVSVIIEGFQSATGAAFFSNEQRQWIDLKKIISRQQPAKRPAVRPTAPFKAWCFDRATKKHDWWGRVITTIYLANVITLCTQSDTQEPLAERIRDYIYLGFASFYAIDVVIRFVGLGWNAYRRSLWCIYDLVVVVGIFANTVPILISQQPNQFIVQLQKFFLTAATLKLVAKHNGLNQLFKTAIAGLPAIVSLLGLWLCFFLFFGLMFVEIFGLTRWGFIGPESYSRNFSSLPLALVFLSMMSTGEGWNAYMHDYTVESPLCTPSSNYLETDCGSGTWAYSLFIGWNLFSMYIFLNMFTGTVVDNFSYIFQLGERPVLDREDMRSFKRTWMKVAGTSSTLPRDKILEFLRALPGKFELRLYPEQLSIHALREAVTYPASIPTSVSEGGFGQNVSLPSRDTFSTPYKGKGTSTGNTFDAFSATAPSMRVIDGINVTRLHDLIFALDQEELRQRRDRFIRVWHEANLLADESEQDKGLSFQNMLKLIAQYKLIDCATAFSMEELVERRKLEEKIDDRINLEKVRSVMKTAYLRYRFNVLRRAREAASAEQESSAVHLEKDSPSSSPYDAKLPRIQVDGILSSPPSLPELDTRSPLRLNTSALSTSPEHRGLRTPPGHSGGFSSLPQDDKIILSPSASSDRSGLTSPSGGRTPLDVAELERRASPLLESFDGTPWGRMMNRMSQGVSRIAHPGRSRRQSSLVLSSQQHQAEDVETSPTEDFAAAPNRYYALDSSDAWTRAGGEPHRSGPTEEEREVGDRQHARPQQAGVNDPINEPHINENHGRDGPPQHQPDKAVKEGFF